MIETRLIAPTIEAAIPVAEIIMNAMINAGHPFVKMAVEDAESGGTMFTVVFAEKETF